MSSCTELEWVWQARLSAARQRYEESTQDFDRVVVESDSGFDPLDGAKLIRQALRCESSALDEYIRTLRVYIDLVIYGTVPEESWSVTMDRRPGPNG